jgi:hypothetical protein
LGWFGRLASPAVASLVSGEGGCQSGSSCLVEKAFVSEGGCVITVARFAKKASNKQRCADLTGRASAGRILACAQRRKVRQAGSEELLSQQTGCAPKWLYGT